MSTDAGVVEFMWVVKVEGDPPPPPVGVVLSLRSTPDERRRCVGPRRRGPGEGAPLLVPLEPPHVEPSHELKI